jgi:hypothetical protein
VYAAVYLAPYLRWFLILYPQISNCFISVDLYYILVYFGVWTFPFVKLV